MLKKFRDIHKDETCVIIGNGPSLRDTPRKLLEKYISFGANKIFALYYELDDTPEQLHGFYPTYYTVVDDKMIYDCVPFIIQNRMDNYPVEEKFMRRDVPLPGINYLRVEVKPGFSTNINTEVILGGTVTNVQLQIAYYMGFTTVLLVGVDHNYHKYNEKKPGQPLLAGEKDDSHFYPGYFSEHHIYNAPELDAVNDITFPLAKHTYESNGRKIINLTPGTKETVFKKGKIKDWL